MYFSKTTQIAVEKFNKMTAGWMIRVDWYTGFTWVSGEQLPGWPLISL